MALVMRLQKRHKADNEINHRTVEVLRNNVWLNVRWKNVLVGDIIKVHINSFFPSDLVLLSSRCVIIHVLAFISILPIYLIPVNHKA